MILARIKSTGRLARMKFGLTPVDISLTGLGSMVLLNRFIDRCRFIQNHSRKTIVIFAIPRRLVMIMIEAQIKT